jgi:hypothetical protein
MNQVELERRGRLVRLLTLAALARGPRTAEGVVAVLGGKAPAAGRRLRRYRSQSLVAVNYAGDGPVYALTGRGRDRLAYLMRACGVATVRLPLDTLHGSRTGTVRQSSAKPEAGS